MAFALQGGRVQIPERHAAAGDEFLAELRLAGDLISVLREDVHKLVQPLRPELRPADVRPESGLGCQMVP